MKKSFCFFMLLIIISLNTSVFSQKKNSLTVSAIADNYVGIKDQFYDGRNLDYNSIPGPGIELSFMSEIFKGLNIGTGINYQLGLASSYINYYERRFKFTDICFPLLLRKYIKIKDYEHLYITTGIYFGKTKNINVDFPGSNGWNRWPDYSTIENYSDDILFSDMYLDFGYHSSLNKLFTISVAPFFKYRINTTWLNYHQNKFHFGIKINYALNF